MAATSLLAAFTGSSSFLLLCLRLRFFESISAAVIVYSE